MIDGAATPATTETGVGSHWADSAADSVCHGCGHRRFEHAHDGCAVRQMYGARYACECTRFEVADARRASLATIHSVMREHFGGNYCGFERQTGDPERMGTLAFDVCGLKPGHDGKHRAGWTGSGEWFE